MKIEFEFGPSDKPHKNETVELVFAILWLLWAIAAAGVILYGIGFFLWVFFSS
jgi:hypothetical protein